MKRFFAWMLFAAACQPAPVGVRGVDVSSDSTQQCVSLCNQIGLPLDSVVIMANNLGCVCRAATPAAAPAQPPAAAPPGASASAGGMAAIMIAEEQARAAAARNAAANKK